MPDEWPQVEETKWTCSQEGTGVEPTGEAKERNTPSTPGDIREWQSWGGNISRGMRQCTAGLYQ